MPWQSSGIIITAGLAEVAAGAIAMGLGGYLAARTDAEHFVSERAREERETKEMPEEEAAEVADVLRSYGLGRRQGGGGGELHPCRQEAVGGLHDALRAWAWRSRTRSEPGTVP